MIQTGTVEYDVNTPKWNLHTGSGDRGFKSPDIQFQAPFDSPPQIMLALSGIDSEHTTNLRIYLVADDVETEEFNIIVNTRDDTLIYYVQITWLAHD